MTYAGKKRVRRPERAVRDMAPTHMTVDELADLCMLGRTTVSNYCRDGKVKALKHGRSWLIPRLDGQLFAEKYVAYNSGETWTPKVGRAPRKVQENCPTEPQKLHIEFPPELLWAIDKERMRRYKETGRLRKNSRSHIIFEAIEAYLLGSDK